MRLYKVLNFIISLICLSSVIGMIFDIPFFVTWVSGGIRIAITTSILFLLTTITARYMIMNRHTFRTSFFVVANSLAIMSTIGILTIFMYLNYYITDLMRFYMYLPAIPTLFMFVLISFQGLIFSLGKRHRSIKIKYLSFGVLTVSILGILQYVSENSFLGNYYLTYNTNMSLVTCSIGFMFGLIFLKIASQIKEEK